MTTALQTIKRQLGDRKTVFWATLTALTWFACIGVLLADPWRLAAVMTGFVAYGLTLFLHLHFSPPARATQ